MTCEEFTALLADFVEGDLPRATHRRCGEHRASCRDCRAYTTSYEATIRLARSAFRGDGPAADPKSVDALIARVLRRTLFAN